MLARQQADSSQGGFAKLAPFFFFLLFSFFIFLFISPYGPPDLFWPLLWVGV